MEKKFQLPKEFGEKWVAALRSGEYEQGKEALFARGAYCCLGVAGKICGVEDGFMDNEGDLCDIEHITKFIMPKDFFDSGYSLQRKLMNLNDDEGKTFPEIADWIEENVSFV